MRACAFGLKQNTLNLLIIMLEERKFIIVISEKSSYSLALVMSLYLLITQSARSDLLWEIQEWGGDELSLLKGSGLITHLWKVGSGYLNL